MKRLIPLFALVLIIGTLGLSPVSGANNPFSDASDVPTVNVNTTTSAGTPPAAVSPTACQTETGTALGKTAQSKKWVINLPNWAVKVINVVFGAELKTGSKITISSSGIKITTKTSTSTSTATNTSTTQPSNSSKIKKLAKQIKSKYGITVVQSKGAKWTEAQLQAADKTLASLPASFRKCTKTLQRDASYNGEANVLGYVKLGVPTVHIMNSACYNGTFQGTIVHEMTHCFQAANPAVTQQWSKTFWPLGGIFGAIPRSVTDYGNSKAIEDMAESCRFYVQKAAWMKKNQSKRYEFIKKYVMAGKEFKT